MGEVTGYWLTTQKSIPCCSSRNKYLEVEMFTKTERRAFERFQGELMLSGSPSSPAPRDHLPHLEESRLPPRLGTVVGRRWLPPAPPSPAEHVVTS